MQDDRPGWLSTRYERVCAHIAAGIREGRLAPGARLDGERRLAADLGLSRETVRQGLELAEQQGLVVRVPQRGTFVAAPRVQQDLGRMRPFRETVHALAMQPTYRPIGCAETVLEGETAGLLAVPPGSRGLAVEVLGLADGLPMALYRSTLPGWVADAIGPGAAWGERASYELAAAALGLASLGVSQEFEAVALRGAPARTLRVRGGAPGFAVTSLFRAPDGRPVERRLAWYPGSRYRFRLVRDLPFGT